ncbi:hypothetical protein [Vibrio phage vB_VhaM_VH-8]|nr:hypothetical protein [Vibrio phage vB_VhaM_VH-8]
MLKLFTRIILILSLSVISITSIASHAANSVKSGTASYYGKKFHLKRTASGEIFNMYKLTCASNTHKMGTKLKVTNISNGKSTSCRVNDTGGFKKYGRVLDLSYGSFIKIADPKVGLIKVKIKKL